MVASIVEPTRAAATVAVRAVRKTHTATPRMEHGVTAELARLISTLGKPALRMGSAQPVIVWTAIAARIAVPVTVSLAMANTRAVQMGSVALSILATTPTTTAAPKR